MAGSQDCPGSSRMEQETEKNSELHSPSTINFRCHFCDVAFLSRAQLQAHCRTNGHQRAVMSDEGRSWLFRAPPRGVGADVYILCAQFASEGFCRFGAQCVDAHSNDELREWRERFDYRQRRINIATEICGKSFVELLTEKLNGSRNPKSILVSSLPDVEVTVDRELDVKVSSKSCKCLWEFHVAPRKHPLILENVALMNEVTRHHFSLVSVKIKSTGTKSKVTQVYDLESEEESSDTVNQQEWSNADASLLSDCTAIEYTVIVAFRADIYGTFRQSVIFDFSQDGKQKPCLKRDLCVDVATVSEEETRLKALKDCFLKQTERWGYWNYKIVDFNPPVSRPLGEDAFLFSKYPSPRPSKFKVTKVLTDSRLTISNYRRRMHELLCIEEMAQYQSLSRFNVVSQLTLAHSYFLTSTSANSSIAKYSRPGELYGKMNLSSQLSEDTPAGRLIVTNCSMLLLMVKRNDSKPMDCRERKAYVAEIEDAGKNALYLRLPSCLVQEYSLKEGEEFSVEVQFQLNRLPVVEMHHAVDQLLDLRIVYPDVNKAVSVPWTPGRQWSDELDSRLNLKQKEAIVAITAPLSVVLPPVLIIGPYGTGKTFTLGQAIKALLSRTGSMKVLVCTHSNSAADLYIREYLDPFILAEKDKRINLLRVYYRNRWVRTVHETVKKYCLLDATKGGVTFRNPTFEDVAHCDVVVATFSTSRHLGNIGLPIGHFTHILLDEAAQALECESIAALALASIATRLVIAGDHMQLSPEVFSQYALCKSFDQSLLERLYHLYPADFPCKILLFENYRSHEAIIGYTSDLFYDRKLITSGKQQMHPSLYPLTMFTARGEDVQSMNSTSFYNDAEVYEVVERVAELHRNWPSNLWGPKGEHSIGVVSPYYDQVQRIRSELRKRKLFGISVERVLNVQGKQFRAVFLSTVRTRKTCVSSMVASENVELDFGFLSNDKLLNTAVTRAQSLVAVVGDPIALCSIGKCRKLWERYMDICHKHNSLFGLTWAALKVMLDNVDMKKSYVLNPLAPEFVPLQKRRCQPQPVLQVSRQGNAKSPVLTVPQLFPLPPNPLVLASLMPFSPSAAAAFGWPLNRPSPAASSIANRAVPASALANSYGSMLPVPAPHSPFYNFVQLPAPQGELFIPPAPARSAVPASHVVKHGSHPGENFPVSDSSQPSLKDNAQHSSLTHPPLINGRGIGQRMDSAMKAPSAPIDGIGKSAQQKVTESNISFKDRVHFPKPQQESRYQTSEATPGQHGCVIDKSSLPLSKEMLSSCMKLLPDHLELSVLLQSPQMLLAWSDHLMVTKGPNEAQMFKDFMKLLQVTSPGIRQQSNKSIDSSVLGFPPGPDPLQEKAAIFAEDLEAELLRESCNNPPAASKQSGSFPPQLQREGQRERRPETGYVEPDRRMTVAEVSDPPGITDETINSVVSEILLSSDESDCRDNEQTLECEQFNAAFSDLNFTTSGADLLGAGRLPPYQRKSFAEDKMPSSRHEKYAILRQVEHQQQLRPSGSRFKVDVAHNSGRTFVPSHDAYGDGGFSTSISKPLSYAHVVRAPDKSKDGLSNDGAFSPYATLLPGDPLAGLRSLGTRATLQEQHHSQLRLLQQLHPLRYHPSHSKLPTRENSDSPFYG